MDEYNLTDEQKRILTELAAGHARDPHSEFALAPEGMALKPRSGDPISNVTVADLYALDDEGLVKRWKDKDDWHFCKPTRKGLEAVRNGFRLPPSPPATSVLVSEPPMIADSLKRFRAAYPDPSKVAFLMLKFATPADDAITQAVRDTLAKYGMIALRADEAEYHEDLYYNVATYMHGCGFGIAVFERLQSGEFNPNVSLEVGYLRALRKPVCLLKDETLQSLHADLVGKLYRSFDPRAVEQTVPAALSAWLKDQGLLD